MVPIIYAVKRLVEVGYDTGLEDRGLNRMSWVQGLER